MAHVVAHIIYHPDAPGLEHLISSLALQLNSFDQSHCLIWIHDGSQPTDCLKGLEYHFIEEASSLAETRQRLNALLRDKRIRTLHTHNLNSLDLISFGHFFKGLSWYHSQHQRPVAKVGGLKWKLVKHVVAATQEIADLLKAKYHLPAKKLSVIPNGIHLEKFDYTFQQERSSEELRKKLGLRNNSLVIGNIGAFVPEEDHVTLLKAFRNSRRKELDAQLIFLGTGPQKNRVEEACRELELEEDVVFVDEQSQPLDVLKAMDIFVTLNYHTSRTFSLIEAMAAGKPVIATKIGSNPEVVVERQTGFLVPCGFPERVDNVFMRLEALPTLVSEMGTQARKHIEDNFDLPRTVKRYKDIYQTT